jgi:hypothetical protein
MRGPPNRVDTSEAIASIRKCAREGVQILGLDGFVVIPEGFVAALGLLLDLSGRNLTVEEAAAEAEAFVTSKSRPDVLWEVWTELS